MSETIRQLENVIIYVAENTRDKWAKEYLLKRLRDIRDTEAYRRARQDSSDAT